VGDDFELTVQKEPNKLVIKILTATKELVSAMKVFISFD